MYAVEERLSSVNANVQIDCTSVASESKSDNMSNEKKTRSGHHYFLTNPSARDDKKERELEGGGHVSSCNPFSKRDAPRDKSMESQVNDVAAFSPSSYCDGRARKGRIKLLEALNTTFMEAYNNFHVNNSTAKYSGGSVHVSIIQHLHDKWRTIIEGLDDSLLLDMIDSSSLRSLQYDSDFEYPEGVSSRGAGTGAVLGKSIAETQLAQLFLPFPDRVTIPSYTAKVEQQEGFQQWPKSYHLYRYLPSLLKRAGIAVQPSLTVNPLQAAGRFDCIISETYQVAAAENANIDFHNAPMIPPKSSAVAATTTTTTTTNTTTATARGSKPRRSRPSNNKNNNTAKTTDDSVDKVNPSNIMEADTIPLRKKAHLDKEGHGSNNVSTAKITDVRMK